MRVLIPGLLLATLCPSWSAEDPVRRAAAALAMEESNPFAKAELDRALRDATPTQRAKIIAGIGTNAERQHADLVGEALSDADGRVAAAAATALAALGDSDPARLEHLRGALDDQRPEVRSAAIAAIGTLRDDRAMPHLIALLDGPARGEAERVLTAFAPDLGLPAQRSAWQVWYDQQRAQIEPQLDQLRDRTASTDPTVVLAAVHELLFLRVAPSDVADILAPLGDHPHADIATLARAALKTSPSPVARQSLLRLAPMPEVDGSAGNRAALAVGQPAPTGAGGMATAPMATAGGSTLWPLLLIVITCAAGFARWRIKRARAAAAAAAQAATPPSGTKRKSRLNVTFSN